MWPSGLVTLTDLSYLGTCTVCTLAYCHGRFRVTGTCFKGIEFTYQVQSHISSYLHLPQARYNHTTTTTTTTTNHLPHSVFFFFLLFFLILRLAPPGLLTVTR